MISSRPPSIPRLRIGLLGGSFNPPHAGHALITRIALKRLKLDRVWWLFSPGNPLKADAPADVAARMTAADAVFEDPRVVFTDIESHLGTRYTADTLATLRKLYHGTDFVWLMGEDNLAQFHRWESWGAIAASVPLAVFSRPGTGFPALNSPTARSLRRFRLPERNAAALANAKPPAWMMLVHPQSDLSSTAIRTEGNWP